MTDGIIQKVLERYLVIIDNHTLDALEKELIAEIKKEFPTNEIPEKNSDINMIPIGNINTEVSRILIGDNE